MRRARSYLDAQATLTLMGYTSGKTPAQVQQLQKLYQSPDNFRRAMDQYLGREPGWRWP